MLAAAPRVVTDLNWLALLAGMVVTMKTYWIALKWRSGVRKPIDFFERSEMAADAHAPTASE